jgi:glycosyltransferase involved in cell wall biosynthesis
MVVRPFVSVLIDTYNHERFIEQAIVSVLEQDVSAAEMEVIVVDDGSTDDTPAIVRKFAPRVRYLRKANGGQASAFNAGIPEARGEIVAFLDGDDWWAGNKLSVVLDRLAKHPEVGTVGHGFYEVDSASKVHRVVVPERDYEVHLRSVPEARLFSQLRSFLGTSRIIVRRTVLEQILPIPEELVVEADEYIFTLAPAISPVMVLNQPLFYYRLHENNQFMIQSPDPAKLRRKQASLAALVHTLPAPLARLGVSPEVIRMVLEPTWVDAERMRLILEGGKPWETFAVERASFPLDYSHVNFGYRLFKWLVLGLTLVTPPRRFYGLRKWYAAQGLRRLRKVLGEPRTAAHVVQTAIESSSRAVDGACL